MIHCVLHDPNDSVAVVVVEGVKAGMTLTGLILDENRTLSLPCLQDIPIGHKVALKDMATGDTVIKYGIDIGKVVAPDHARPARARPQHQDQALVGGDAPSAGCGRRRGYAHRPNFGPAPQLRSRAPLARKANTMQKTFWGYRRENGRVGVRNHVIILPVDDLSNAACEAVANNIKGTMAIPHPYGRLQFGADLDLHFRTLIGTGSNPNVAAVVVIGIEEQWTKKSSTASPRPASRSWASASSCTATTTRSCAPPRRPRSSCRTRAKSIASSARCPSCGSRPSAASPTRPRAAAPTRPSATRSTSSTRAGCTLVFGETTELTGGESIVAARCRDDKVRADFMRMFDRYQDVVNRHKTSDLSDSQPTKGNIAGGLTTIEEKALGNIQKIGKKCIVDGVLDKAEVPTGPGLWFMDSSSAAAEMVTLVAAAGFVVHFFPTGQGNVIGNPILPVIKICANPRTVRTMSEHIDVDASGLLQREITMDQAGDKLLDMMFRTANGRLTAAEALGHREFVLTRLYESA